MSASGAAALWPTCPANTIAKLLAASPLGGEVGVEVAQELPELFEAPTREGRQGGYQGGNRGNRDEGGYRGRGQSSGGYQGGGRSQSSGGYQGGGRSQSSGGYQGGGRSQSGGGQGGYQQRGAQGGRPREDFADREFVPAGR